MYIYVIFSANIIFNINKFYVQAEVVSFQNSSAYLTPFGQRAQSIS